MKVKEIMHKAFAVDFDLTIKDAAKVMHEHNIGSLIVVKGEKILGIVTEKDIVDNVNNLAKKVSSVMVKNVKVIDEDEEIENAAISMKKNKIKRLPVLNEDGKLMGVITVTDLIANSEELNEDFLFE